VRKFYEKYFLELASLILKLQYLPLKNIEGINIIARLV